MNWLGSMGGAGSIVFSSSEKTLITHFFSSVLVFSPGKTARERWKLFKNVSRVGLQRNGISEGDSLSILVGGQFIIAFCWFICGVLINSTTKIHNSHIQCIIRWSGDLAFLDRDIWLTIFPCPSMNVKPMMSTYDGAHRNVTDVSIRPFSQRVFTQIFFGRTHSMFMAVMRNECQSWEMCPHPLLCKAAVSQGKVGLYHIIRCFVELYVDIFDAYNCRILLQEFNCSIYK